MLTKIADKTQNNAAFMRKFHGWATVIWLAASVPICIWLNTSVPFLVFLSVYSIVVGHWGSSQSARTEEKQDIADKKTSDNV